MHGLIIILTILTVWFPLLMMFSTARLPSQIFLLQLRSTGNRRERYVVQYGHRHHSSDFLLRRHVKALIHKTELKCVIVINYLFTQECEQSKHKCHCVSQRRSLLGQLPWEWWGQTQNALVQKVWPKLEAWCLRGEEQKLQRFTHLF